MLILTNQGSNVPSWLREHEPRVRLLPQHIAVDAQRHDTREPIDHRLEALEERVPPGTGIWAAVAHGDVAEQGEALVRQLRERWRIRLAILQPLSPSIFLHVGPGGLLLFAAPVEAAGLTDLDPAELTGAGETPGYTLG